MRRIETAALVTLTTACMNTTRLEYPVTRRDTVVDDYHGIAIADPYRWLEDQNAPATAEWVAAQNAITEAYLARLPGRDRIERRLTALWNSPRVGVPYRQAGRLYYARNTGLQQQSVHFERATIDAEPRVILDPNEISPDGKVAVAATAVSPDGRLLAYALAEGGADLQAWTARDLASGKETGDTVRNVKFSSASWTEDGKGFFYSRYPEPPAGQELTFKAAGHQLFYHTIGTPQSADQLIFWLPDRPDWLVLATVSEDGRYLIVYAVWGTSSKNEIYAADLGDPMRPNVQAPIRPVVTGSDAEYLPIGTVGNTLYLRTDLDAPRRRIIAVDLTRPDRGGWRRVVDQSLNVIEGVALAGDKLVLQYLVDVKSELALFGQDGKPAGSVPLPGIGAVTSLSARQDTPELWYSFVSFLSPATVYRYDLTSGTSAPFEPPATAFDASPYQTTQVFYRSKDGTRVPMFVTGKTDLARDGSNPVLMYGYGGFTASMLPFFSAEYAAWLEMGGLLAVPNLRGGSEYGDEWHQAGMLHRKQNVFDDFVAAAEYLISERYSSATKLAISGASNGGLLVGAAMTQRPDLFAVALPAVGVLDMLRFDKFTAGVFWVTEYGSASNPDDFRVIHAYSPLHNLRAGTCYPATLITTADHDDRVIPGHSFKFAAALQAAQGCDKPALIRIETQGSHGYRPTAKEIAEAADVLAFTAANLGISVSLPQ
jgi:prolyl oligopeptidase